MKKHTSLRAILGFTAAVSITMIHASSFFDDLLGSTVSHHSSSTDHESYATSNGMSESKASTYVKSVLRSLNRAFAPYLKKKTLKSLEETITYNTLSNGTTYEWTSQGKRFNKDLIDQVFASVILQSIEEAAYRYAYKKSRSSTFATQVSTSMRNNALARMDSRGALAFDTLIIFVGSSMKKEVARLLSQQGFSNSKPTSSSYSNTYPKPSAPVQFETASYDFKTYPSTECAVCYEDLTSHSRIFLKPCGHDMCKSCASTWFFTNHKNSCPQCRSTVDRDHLSIALATL